MGDVTANVTPGHVKVENDPHDEGFSGANFLKRIPVCLALETERSDSSGKHLSIMTRLGKSDSIAALSLC